MKRILRIAWQSVYYSFEGRAFSYVCKKILIEIEALQKINWADGINEIHARQALFAYLKSPMIAGLSLLSFSTSKGGM